MTALLDAVTHEAIARAKDDLATAFRVAAMHGYNEGIDNHFSLAVPGRNDLFLLNRYGPHWSEMTVDDILTVDLSGSVVDGSGHWEVTAFMIHRGCHRAHPDARAVFHTHQPYATAVAITSGGLDTRLSQNATLFHDRVSRVDYEGLADGEAEGDRIAAGVRDGAIAVLLDNHGVITVGIDVPEAWHRPYFLEQAARVQVLAQSTGGELIRMREEVARRTATQWDYEPQAARALFDAERRRLMRG